MPPGMLGRNPVAFAGPNALQAFPGGLTGGLTGGPAQMPAMSVGQPISAAPAAIQPPTQPPIAVGSMAFPQGASSYV